MQSLGCPDCKIPLVEKETLGLEEWNCGCGYWVKNLSKGILASKPMVLLMFENISETNNLHS